MEKEDGDEKENIGEDNLVSEIDESMRTSTTTFPSHSTSLGDRPLDRVYYSGPSLPSTDDTGPTYETVDYPSSHTSSHTYSDSTQPSLTSRSTTFFSGSGSTDEYIRMDVRARQVKMVEN